MYLEVPESEEAGRKKEKKNVYSLSSISLSGSVWCSTECDFPFFTGVGLELRTLLQRAEETQHKTLCKKSLNNCTNYYAASARTRERESEPCFNEERVNVCRVYEHLAPRFNVWMSHSSATSRAERRWRTQQAAAREPEKCRIYINRLCAA